MENGSNKYIIYTDGGSRGNPGPSAAAFVIFTENGDFYANGEDYIGIATNNQAEYHALIMALSYAHTAKLRNILVRSDSTVMVEQMKKNWAVKHKDLLPKWATAQNMAELFDSFEIEHVRRQFNKDADAGVNKVLDEREN